MASPELFQFLKKSRWGYLADAKKGNRQQIDLMHVLSRMRRKTT